MMPGDSPNKDTPRVPLAMGVFLLMIRRDCWRSIWAGDRLAALPDMSGKVQTNGGILTVYKSIPHLRGSIVTIRIIDNTRRWL